MQKAVRNQPRDERVAAAYARAAQICDEDVENNRKIGEHGLGIIQAHAEKKGGRAGQHPHPLQRRLARLRRLGHGACADLPRP